jgi:hypothetical protein
LTYHVNVEDGHTCCEVVLVKDTSKLVVCEDGALVESPTAWWIKCTTLELLWVRTDLIKERLRPYLYD